MESAHSLRVSEEKAIVELISIYNDRTRNVNRLKTESHDLAQKCRFTVHKTVTTFFIWNLDCNSIKLK